LIRESSIAAGPPKRSSSAQLKAHSAKYLVLPAETLGMEGEEKGREPKDGARRGVIVRSEVMSRKAESIPDPLDPLVIDGVEVGEVPIADILPRAAR
jgi:hypothetical protein